jgi:hypothetical protein
LRVLKVCGEPGNCNKEELIKSHGHNELKPVELLSVYFEKNLKTRSSVETKPLPQVYREEESKSYKEAIAQGLTTEEVAAINTLIIHKV